MAKHRIYSVEFKRQVSQEYLGGETLHAFSKRYDISRNLIRIWVEKYQAGALDEDAAAADLLQAYEARVAALERLVGKQALELEFLKGALHARPRAGNGPTSAITGKTIAPEVPNANARLYETALYSIKTALYEAQKEKTPLHA
jgi:transposase